MRNFKAIAAMLLLSISSTITFTSCQDDTLDDNKQKTAPESAQKALMEAYGLTFENFVTPNDVQILNADTTEISVNKALAEKLGITSFVNHPLGIWDAKSHMPYARKASGERLIGDRYILTVGSTTVAELIGNKKVTLNTSVYVNPNVTGNQTRAGIDMPSYAAKYMDENDVIHPAVILYTDPYGYDKEYHTLNDKPQAGTRAGDGFQYVTADELAQEGSRASVRRRILSVHTDTEIKKDIPVASKKINLKYSSRTDFELNYFLTLNGGCTWKAIFPSFYVDKFEAGLDGEFAFSPEFTVGVSDELELDKDKYKWPIVKFPSYSFTFWIGPVPVVVTADPSIFFRLDGKINTSAQVGFKYEYANKFKGGFRYQNGKGWETIKDFEEIKNEFTPIWPTGKISAELGFGLYLGVDVLLYGAAGPEMAVGPRIGAKGEGTFSIDEGKDFKASVDVTVNAEAGAKLKVLGYEIAEWHKTFELTEPWNLWSYPKTGNEHKSPAAKKTDEMRKLMEKACSAQNDKEAMSELTDMMAQMQNMKHEDAEKKLAEAAIKLTENSKDEQAKMQTIVSFVNKENKEMKPKFEKWRIDKNWSDIVNMLKTQEKAKIIAAHSDGYFNERNAFSWTHQRFVEKFNREPKQNEEDLQYLIKEVVSYRDVAYNKAIEEVLKDPIYKRCREVNAKLFDKTIYGLHDYYTRKYAHHDTPSQNYINDMKYRLRLAYDFYYHKFPV
jgi:hypothetical protein